MRRLLACALVLVPAVATANPITAGVGLGVSQSKTDGESGADANRTLGLFGRLGFTERLSGQLEVARIKTEDGSGVEIRSGTALAILDLGKRSFVPLLLAGVGVANASSDYSDVTATHVELGAGIEYRGSNGITVGADLRIGSRSIEEQNLPVYDATSGYGSVARYAPSTLQDGEYRSARITVGVRF